MDPIMASQALRLIAQSIELSRSPSLSEVTSELEQVLQYVDSGVDIRTAGPMSWMKGLKRKVVNTKGEKKILDRIDHLQMLMDTCQTLAKKIRRGEDMTDLVNDEDQLQALEGVAEFLSGVHGESEALREIADAGKDLDIGSAFAELDEYWLEDEEAEGSDREIIVNAIADFRNQCDERIKKNKKLLQKQKLTQKKKLPVPRSQQRKPKEPAY